MLPKFASIVSACTPALPVAYGIGPRRLRSSAFSGISEAMQIEVAGDFPSGFRLHHFGEEHDGWGCGPRSFPAEIYLDQKSIDRRNYIRFSEIPVFMLAHGRRRSEIHPEAFDPARAAPPLPTVSVPPARAPCQGDRSHRPARRPPRTPTADVGRSGEHDRTGAAEQIADRLIQGGGHGLLSDIRADTPPSVSRTTASSLSASSAR